MPTALSPGSHIGIIGGGQLGMYLAQSAKALGFHANIYTDAMPAPAAKFADSIQLGAYDNAQAVSAFAQTNDCLTYEFENISCDALAPIAEKKPLRPPLKALALTQDRLCEKLFCQRHNIATARFADITTLAGLKQNLKAFGGTGILKTRRFGYDGKGQWRLEAATPLEPVWDALAGRPAILESHIAFEREVSLICARFADGHIVFFDMAENTHREGILRTSRIPAHMNGAQTEAARQISRRCVEALAYIGIFTIEFFVHEGALLVNEFAPRVHNSGHWTLDGCATSQFEQHIRAIANLPAGDITRQANARMTNLIGAQIRAWQSRRSSATRHIHIYGKSDIKAGRKMGHVTELRPLGS